MGIMLSEIYQDISEKIILKNLEFPEYAKLVARAYKKAPINDSKAHSAYNALNRSNYTFWRKLRSKVDIQFTTEDKSEDGKTFSIDGKKYITKFLGDQPYATAADMAASVKKEGILKISMDYSSHPYFSVEDNIVFRSVHDYIVHILGGKPFGLKGEIQAYNLHAKLVPESGKSAIFTEVVGQVCYYFVYKKFPVQKCAILHGFDYDVIGKVIDNK